MRYFLAILAICWIIPGYSGCTPLESGGTSDPSEVTQEQPLLHWPPRKYWRDGQPNKILAPSAHLSLGDHLILGSVRGDLIWYNLRTGEEDHRYRLGQEATHLIHCGDLIVVGTEPLGDRRPHGMIALSHHDRKTVWEKVLQDVEIDDLKQLDDHHALIASKDGALMTLDTRTGTFSQRKQILKPARIDHLTILPTSYGIWLASFKEIVFLDLGSWETVKTLSISDALAGTRTHGRYDFRYPQMTSQGILMCAEEILGDGNRHWILYKQSSPTPEVLCSGGEHLQVTVTRDLFLKADRAGVSAWSLSKRGALWDCPLELTLPSVSMTWNRLFFQATELGLIVLDLETGVVCGSFSHPGRLSHTIIPHPLGFAILADAGLTALYRFRNP